MRKKPGRQRISPYLGVAVPGHHLGHLTAETDVHAHVSRVGRAHEGRRVLVTDHLHVDRGPPGARLGRKTAVNGLHLKLQTYQVPN